jgi:2'-5' RNA ligase
LRLFLASEIPDSHKRAIEKAIQPLRLALPQARWVGRESWHLTLKFLGEVPEERFDDVVRIASREVAKAAPVETELTELGGFPNLRRPRVLWVGLEDPGEVFAKLSHALERSYGRRGFRKESRKLHPHVTLARLRTPTVIEESLAEAGEVRPKADPFPVDEVVLFRSYLSPKGARYEAIERFPLGSA